MRRERVVNFNRPLRMICDACQHEWLATNEWVRDFYFNAALGCPKCGENCEGVECPKAHHDVLDPVLKDSVAREVYWYHSSTHADWPRREYDRSKEWSPEHQERMRRETPGFDWLAYQSEIALHVGTYEAAIQNIYRRIADQCDGDKQFYLYRVRLRDDVVFRQDLLREHSGDFGDVRFDEVCPDGTHIARYVNLHEDEGSISLALQRDSIRSVQKVAVPLSVPVDVNFAEACRNKITVARSLPVPPRKVVDLFGEKLYLPNADAPLTRVQREIIEELRCLVPPLLQQNFQEAVETFFQIDEVEETIQRAQLLADLVQNPQRVLDCLNNSEERYLV